MPDSSGYWLLIAVLQSTIPLEQALAMRLYHAALELELVAGSSQEIHGDLAQGRVRRLGKHLLIGTIGGPAFEADIDTPRGTGRVSFVLTPEGLERAAAQHTPKGLPN